MDSPPTPGVGPPTSSMSYGPPAYIPPPTPDQMVAYAQAENRRRARSGAGLLIGAGAIHFLSIPVTLVLLKAYVESFAGRAVSWDELWNALATVDGLGILVWGIVGQVAFAVVALAGAAMLYRGRTAVAVPIVVAGVVALIFSILVFGGIVGLIGGVLSIAGGARSRPMPPPPAPFYPPYAYGPPPGSPPYPPPRAAGTAARTAAAVLAELLPGVRGVRRAGDGRAGVGRVRTTG